MQDVINRHIVDTQNNYSDFDNNTMGVWLQMYPTVCANVDQYVFALRLAMFQ